MKRHDAMTVSRNGNRAIVPSHLDIDPIEVISILFLALEQRREREFVGTEIDKWVPLVHAVIKSE